MIKYFGLLLLTLLIISCGDDKKSDTETTDKDESDTISLSPEELFSSTLLEDILQSSEDDDLKSYLEGEIYPIVANSTKVTIDRVSASLYLLSYDENGVQKNFIIQKFYNPSSLEMYFEINELETNAVDQYLK
jgi:hypothetical protein